jgi:P2 family phage contractile tail tube protein
MAQKELPRFLMRDCMLYVDRENYVGQIGDITPPVPQAKVEELRNAGMIKPREIKLGYEKFEFSFKMPGLDPSVMALFGIRVGEETPFMITGALVHEDGTVSSAVITLRGYVKQADNGTWKTGEMGENDYQVAVHYYKLEVDGEEILEVDDFDVKRRGVSEWAPIRNALLL